MHDQFVKDNKNSFCVWCKRSMTFPRKLVAVTRVQPPFTNPCVFTNPDCQVSGINFDIFRTLMTILGFEYSLIQAEDQTTGYLDENGTWRGMVAQLCKV